MSRDIAPSCGSCTLCCTVMKVTMPEYVKPAHETCSQCSTKGCGIYADRPEVCATFQCLWLATQQAPAFALPRTMRPDRCGVMIDLNSAGTILAHCEFPASWKAEPMRSWLLAMTRRGLNVMLDSRDGVQLLQNDGSTCRLRYVGIDPATHNRVYVPEAAA